MCLSHSSTTSSGCRFIDNQLDELRNCEVCGWTFLFVHLETNYSIVMERKFANWTITLYGLLSHNIFRLLQRNMFS